MLTVSMQLTRVPDAKNLPILNFHSFSIYTDLAGINMMVQFQLLLLNLHQQFGATAAYSTSGQYFLALVV